jgi:hypothetical protein
VSLASGTRLGPYEIQTAIDAGRMGEVYRARDMTITRVEDAPESYPVTLVVVQNWHEAPKRLGPLE